LWGSATTRGGGQPLHPIYRLVRLPERDSFKSPAAYYATLFHELTHSTGHASRLNRKGITDAVLFGSHEYSREELIAEMGSAFLAGHCGIETATLPDAASYIANWLRVLKGDKRMVVLAAAQAQKAADFVLAVKHGDEPLQEVA
jgi:antirestriction protein ArdC